MSGPLLLGEPVFPGGGAAASGAGPLRLGDPPAQDGPLRLGAAVAPVTDGAAPARLRVRDGFAFVILDNPPGNLLDHATRQAVAAALDRAGRDPQVRAIVLIGAGRDFCGGRDPLEEAGLAPTTAALCNRIEASALPVVAALGGEAAGAGAELALAAHYRIAAGDARLSFPDIALGLPPGAGGTQRLPRLAGARAALGLLLDGRPMGAAAAQEAGLVDALAPGDLPAAARAFAEGLVENGAGPRPARALRRHSADPGAWIAAVAERRARPAPQLHHRVADCVEAALLLRFEAGLAFEREVFLQALADPEGRALRHLHRAARRIDPGLMALPGATDAAGASDSGTAAGLATGGTGGDALSGEEEASASDPGTAAEAATITGRGEAVLARLQVAFDRAVVWLVGAGVSEAAVDAALAGYGYAWPPFGGAPGRGGAAGQQGAQASPEAQVIVRRCLGALLAEGARLVEEGAVARPSDIDALGVHGLGFPAARGGPMHAAEAAGLLRLWRDMGGWAADDPVWTPCAFLSGAAVSGRGFGDPVPRG